MKKTKVIETARFNLDFNMPGAGFDVKEMSQIIGGACSCKTVYNTCGCFSPGEVYTCPGLRFR